ncbi:MAG: ABC transporter ATP-binding protein [Betaproteobacteria bacterium]|nr:ABC transporter ATP-binding protein [Betaproteobacteria bacterium]MDE2123209.1 ABC transporter ATP-binding protein [Betaproteobacteria bacterium]MDE2186719.1 ABC transporter ATP-binding protein [Betaproteobacteria bacterium]MDE2323939.1 ABC transporter ATP-binding protein [Betaproteobacteria bacterium]
MTLLPKQPLVEFDAVEFGYDVRQVLTQVSLRVMPGEVVAVMGASGGGKTTTLRLIGGQIRATAGRVCFDGRDVGAMRHAELYAARRRMGMLFQMGALFTDQTVFENVAFALREHTPLPESMIRDLALMKLNAVGLRGARDLYPAQLSGGMARRVALARAIALDPALVMYDEPFAGLDPISLGISARLIRTLNDALGLTSIVVSHDVDETFAIADRVFILGNGTLIADGTPAELRASADPLVHQFVRGEPDGPVSFHYPAAPLQTDFLGTQAGRR